MKRAHWTLRADEIDLVAVKHGDSKLAFALLLRFYGRFGRFPRNRGELHPDAVEFMARAVKADPAELAGYDRAGSSQLTARDAPARTGEPAPQQAT
jgi:hypothetical protein